MPIKIVALWHKDLILPSLPFANKSCGPSHSIRGGPLIILGVWCAKQKGFVREGRKKKLIQSWGRQKKFVLENLHHVPKIINGKSLIHGSAIFPYKNWWFYPQTYTEMVGGSLMSLKATNTPTLTSNIAFWPKLFEKKTVMLCCCISETYIHWEVTGLRWHYTLGY